MYSPHANVLVRRLLVQAPCHGGSGKKWANKKAGADEGGGLSHHTSLFIETTSAHIHQPPVQTYGTPVKPVFQKWWLATTGDAFCRRWLRWTRFWPVRCGNGEARPYLSWRRPHSYFSAHLEYNRHCDTAARRPYRTSRH